MLGVLDTLYYLAKGGRIPRVAAWAGSMLKIKPILIFNHEGIGLLERVRTRARAMVRLREIMCSRIKGQPAHVIIMHANALDMAEELKADMETQLECTELYITDFSPTMGVQAGPV